MRLIVMQPTDVLVDTEVVRVAAEAVDGAFTVLPNHIDMATALEPGVLVYETPDGDERFAGIDEGVFVKQGDQVRVVTRRGAVSDDLASLRQRIEEEFKVRDKHEQQARTAMGKIEATFVHRLIELEHGT
ncbi:MAG: F0F1 ATP synthase subunit epsilon [Planctomycetota bacterium]